jgi:hypothetical protein
MFKGITGSLLIGFAALALAAPAHGQLVPSFDYTDFASTAGLSFNGVAVQTGSAISVTPPAGASAGSVWRSGNESVGLGFLTEFTFRISDIAGVGADGFAFVIQNEGTSALGGTGGAIGYATNTVFPSQIGIGNSVAIEFDMWNNGSNWSDFGNANHISIQTNGLSANLPGSANSMGQASPATNMSDGATHTVRILYTPGIMEVYLDDLDNAVLSASVVLTDHMALTSGRAFVGFTAATGAEINAQRHEILSWRFGTFSPAPGSAALLAIGGLVGLRRARR